MNVQIPTPRLLPLTIVALTGLLVLKSVTLVRAAVGGADQTAAQSTVISDLGASIGARDIGPPALPALPTHWAQASPPPTAPQTPARAGSAPSAGAAARAGVPPQGAAAPMPIQASTASTNTGPAGTSPPNAAPSGAPAPAITDGERAVLLDLRQRRKELDAREMVVAAREATLAAAELRLTARVTELETLQHNLEALEQAREQRDDASWAGLVKLYESMKPRDAAAIFNELDMKVLIGVVDRMKDAKAAAVLAAMQAEKARTLTTKLAELRTKRAAVAQGN